MFVLTKVQELVDELAEAVDAFDPDVVHPDDAEALMAAFVRGERVCASGKTRAATRAAKTHAWKRDGHRSADEWLADKTGETRGRAKRTLELGERLERHEETRERYTRGELSETQADIVAGAADENPDAEGDLLEAAERESVKALKEEAARARAAVADEEARQERIHRERYASASTDEEGAYRLSARMSAFQGSIVDAIWRRFREQIVKDARKRGQRLSAGQIGADGLVLMAQTAVEHLDDDSPTPGSNGLRLPPVTLNLLVDEAAWQRGHTEAGETCEVDGLGPVTVTQAKTLTGQQAFVTANTWDGRDVHHGVRLGTCDPTTLTTESVREALAERGVDVQAIESEGRHVPAVLDTAITIRDRVCTQSGCDRRFGLQRDHVLAVELDGKTSYRNLQRLCWHHHQAKTQTDMTTIRAKKQRERARSRGSPATRAGPPPTRAGPAPARAGPAP